MCEPVVKESSCKQRIEQPISLIICNNVFFRNTNLYIERGKCHLSVFRLLFHIVFDVRDKRLERVFVNLLVTQKSIVDNMAFMVNVH